MVNFLKRWWLPALIAVLPFERIPSLDVDLGPHTVTLRLSLVVAAAGIVLFGPSLLRRIRFNFASPYFWLAAYMIVMLASALISVDKVHSLVAIFASCLTIGSAVVIAHVVRLKDLPLLQKIVFITAAAAAIFGLYQFIGDSLGLPDWLTGLRPIYKHNIFGFPRIQSTGLEPLFFANYLLLPILLATALIVVNIRARLLAYAQLFLFALVLALTLSRGGIYAAVFGLMVLSTLLIKQVSWKHLTLTFMTIVLAAGSAIGLIYATTKLSHSPTASGNKAVKSYVKQSTTLTSNAGSTDNDRVLNRHLALDAFVERPLLGYGIGSFGAYAQQAAPLNYPRNGNYPTVNNEYFEILAETGVAGALALAGFVITLFLRLIGAWRVSLKPYHRVWIATLVATCAAYAVQYYAFSTLYIPHIWATVGLLLGLISPGVVQAQAKPGKR